MRKLLQLILLKPVLWAASKFASKPQREKIFSALSRLLNQIQEHPGKRGIIIPYDANSSKFIIFSDQHRGAKNGADDFAKAEPNYLTALDYYFQNGYYFISLGDSEELWENSLGAVKKHNTVSFEKEKLFIQQNRFAKVFGNHDLLWDNDPLAWWHLKKIYGQEVKVYEGVVLQSSVRSQQSATSNQQPVPGNQPLTIFLTHGHQGDASSDGNLFSKFFVARIWAPLQAYLKINPNTPAYDSSLKTKHNHMMYEWSSQQKDLILVTGHTHQPVFESLTHLERLCKSLEHSKKLNDAEAVNKLEEEIEKRKHSHSGLSDKYLSMKPTYFNTGCCCFSDGDITGIEIAEGKIRLIKWSIGEERKVLEETCL